MAVGLTCSETAEKSDWKQQTKHQINKSKSSQLPATQLLYSNYLYGKIHPDISGACTYDMVNVKSLISLTVAEELSVHLVTKNKLLLPSPSPQTRHLWILIELCPIYRYHKHLHYNTSSMLTVLTPTFTFHVTEQVPQFICFCWRFHTTNKNVGRVANCQRWHVGNGQRGTYVSHYNVIACIQQRLCRVHGEAARLILENNNTKIKYDQLIQFLWMPTYFSKLEEYFIVFMTNRKEGRRKTHQR